MEAILALAILVIALPGSTQPRTRLVPTPATSSPTITIGGAQSLLGRESIPCIPEPRTP